MVLILRKLLGLVTMYRLMLYFLLGIFVINLVLVFLNILPYSASDIFLGACYFLLICNLVNYLFSKTLSIGVNLESASISALILTLIVGPLPFLENIVALSMIGFFAIASKYVFVFKKKHIFNPVAAGVLISAILLRTGASWWVGDSFTLPFIIIGGLVILVKIQRIRIAASFLAVYLLSLLLNNDSILSLPLNVPIWFFVMVMLIEPVTSPDGKRAQLLFGAFVGLVYFLFSKITPGYQYGLESALLAGNLFSRIISPSFNLDLKFRRKEKVANNTWSFYFEPSQNLKFTPGQYVELTYFHKNADSRGVRRFFTLSSSPNEKYITITTRVSEKGSSFKNAIMNLKNGDRIMASGPRGEFVLPEERDIPLAFIAGGIGVTPFKSMIGALLASGEKRDIVLLYSSNTVHDAAFLEMFKKAEKVGIKTLTIFSNRDGFIDKNLIMEKIPDFQKRQFYISGPEPMVEVFAKMLSGMKVKRVKTDYFPGYSQTR